MKHIVIGGNGFTGRHLVQALRHSGHDVLVADLDDNGAAQTEGASFKKIDITRPEQLNALPLDPDDIVYHLAARQYHLAVPKANQSIFFDEVNVDGTANVLARMLDRKCHSLIYFSTDMVYGIPREIPLTVDHPCNPIGPYGGSKLKAEAACNEARAKGMHITVFRPRMIVGPGRLGILSRLFKFISLGLPVPMIGYGTNSYQMVSVFDCVSAAICALEKGIPNGTFNLGSEDPPQVRVLLRHMIDEVSSSSRLLAVPGSLVKLILAGFERIGLPLMHKEQYAIADLNYVVDIERTKVELGWRPRYDDRDMLVAAYHEFKKTKNKSNKR